MSVTLERTCGELRAIAFLLHGAIEQLPADDSYTVLRAWFQQCEHRLARLADAIGAEIANPDVRTVEAYERVGKRWLSPFIAGSLAVGALSGVATGALEAVGGDVWAGLKAAASKAYDTLDEVDVHIGILSAMPDRADSELDDLAKRVHHDRLEAFISSFPQLNGE